MIQLTPKYWPASLALLLNRMALGIFFLLAGLHKLQGGYEAWLTQYRSMTPSYLPAWFAQPYGYVVPVLEVLLGSLLIVGLFGRITAAVAFLALASFTLALYAKMPLWGAGFSGGGPFHANFIYLPLAFSLAVFGPGRWSLDTAFWCRVCKLPGPRPGE